MAIPRSVKFPYEKNKDKDDDYESHKSTDGLEIPKSKSRIGKGTKTL